VWWLGDEAEHDGADEEPGDAVERLRYPWRPRREARWLDAASNASCAQRAGVGLGKGSAPGQRHIAAETDVHATAAAAQHTARHAEARTKRSGLGKGTLWWLGEGVGEGEASQGALIARWLGFRAGCADVCAV
jgi:hypothetical protein